MIKKIIVLLIFLLSNFISWSQVETIDSVRWIRILRSKTNSPLFSFSGMNDSTLFGCTWRNANSGESVFFLESKDISDKSPMYTRLLKYPFIDSLIIDPCITNHWECSDLEESSAIKFAYDINNPLTNSQGYPIIVVMDYGFLCYTYPPRTYTLIPIDNIDELRIKEVRYFDESTNAYNYRPIAVQLTPQKVGQMSSEIWLDLEKLKLKWPDVSNLPWFQFIENKNYSGKKYMQL